MTDKKENELTPAVLSDLSGLNPFMIPHLRAERRVMLGGHLSQRPPLVEFDECPPVDAAMLQQLVHPRGYATDIDPALFDKPIQSVFTLEDRDAVYNLTPQERDSLRALHEGYGWTLEMNGNGYITKFTDEAGIEHTRSLPNMDDRSPIDFTGIQSRLNAMCFPIWDQLRKGGWDLTLVDPTSLEMFGCPDPLKEVNIAAMINAVGSVESRLSTDRGEEYTFFLDNGFPTNSIQPIEVYRMKPRDVNFDGDVFHRMMKWDERAITHVAIKGRSRRKRRIRGVKRLLRTAVKLMLRLEEQDYFNHSEYGWAVQPTGRVVLHYSDYRGLIGVAVYDPITRQLIVSREGMAHCLHGINLEYLRDFVQGLRMQIWYENTHRSTAGD